MAGGKNKTRYRQVSRDLVAFQYLMEDEDIARGRPSPGGGTSKSRKEPGRNRRGGNAFQLRDKRAEPGGQHSNSSRTAPTLAEMFPQFDRAVVDEVSAQFPDSLEQAAEALLALNLESASSSAAPSKQDGNAALMGPQIWEEGTRESGPDLWDVLPTECKRLVLQHLALKDVARAARTCRELAQYADDLLSARTTVNIPYGLTTAQITGMCRAHKNLKAVSLYSCREQFKHEWDYQRVMQALSAGTQGGLQSLDVRGFQLSDHDIPMLLSTLPCLKSLKVDDCHKLTDQTLKLLSQHKPSSPASKSDTFAARDSFLEDPGRLSFGAAEQTNSKAVERRFVGIRDRVWEAAMVPPPAAAVAGSAGFECISLQGLPEVTDEGVRLLLRSRSLARSLTQLDVSRCPKITGMCLSLLSEASLRTLKAGKCAAIKSLELRLTGASSLTELSIPGCNNLKSLEVVAPSLVSLNASGCKSLETFSCSGVRMERLLMPLCTSLLDYGLRVDCPSITNMNISQCHSITSAGLESFVGSAPKLRSLNINGCTSVGTVLLTRHAALESLDMAGCRSAATLRSNSQKLRQLNAAGCTGLKAVELSASEMDAINLTNTALPPIAVAHFLQLRSHSN